MSKSCLDVARMKYSLAGHINLISIDINVNLLSIDIKV